MTGAQHSSHGPALASQLSPVEGSTTTGRDFITSVINFSPWGLEARIPLNDGLEVSQVNAYVLAAFLYKAMVFHLNCRVSCKEAEFLVHYRSAVYRRCPGFNLPGQLKPVLGRKKKKKKRWFWRIKNLGT